MNPGAPTAPPYSYANAGIDNFLMRSIDDVTWQDTLHAYIAFPGNVSLTSAPVAGNPNMATADGTSTSGSQGNTLSVGAIQIDGSTGTISFSNSQGQQQGVIGNVTG